MIVIRDAAVILMVLGTGREMRIFRSMPLKLQKKTGAGLYRSGIAQAPVFG